MENKKLYRVTLKGMTHNCTGIIYGVSYVVAESSDKAYQIVRSFLDKEDLGSSKDRELDKVELIADTYQYTDVDNLLFLDYPDLITTKAITEKGRENIQKITEMIREIIKEHDIEIDFSPK